MTNDEKQEVKENNISISDAIKWQDSLKKGIDFDKPDSELSPEELVNKMVYLAMDKSVEKSVGKDVKKDLDEKRKKIEMLAKFQTNLDKLVELGKEIEKNLIWQGAYLINHFDKSKENHFHVVVTGMTMDVVDAKKSMSNDERVEFAKKILKITKVYREKVIKDLHSKQEIISALIPALEKHVSETDFNLFGDEIDDKNSAEYMKSQFQEWINLSKELFKYRRKAIEAAEEDLDIEDILPKYVVENNGDITKNLSVIEMTTKGDRMIRLIKEADKVEKKIKEKRSKISESLFGKAEDYMEFQKMDESKETTTKNQPGDGMGTKTKWFIVIALSVVALSWGIWTAIGVFMLGVIIISILSK